MSWPFRKEVVIGSDAPDAFYVGRYWYEESGFERPRFGPKMQMPGTEPVGVCGRNRSGKDIGIGIYNALRLQGRSWWMYDPRGEGASVSAPYRRTLGPTRIINPDGLHTNTPGYTDLKSDRRNPFEGRDPTSDDFFDEVAAIVAAWMRLPAHGDPHWMLSARGAVQALSMWEIERAAIEGRRPASPLNVRMMLTEADEFDPNTGEPIKGFAATAARIVKEGSPQAASLIGRFAGPHNDETQGVRATADGATQWKLSSVIARDMAVTGGADPRELGEYPSSHYLILPQHMVETHSAFVRETLSSSLRALSRPTNTVCTFYINEFATLGKSEAIESALGMVAGSGIQLVFVVQSLTNLLHYGKDSWENFMGQAGCVVLIGPPADKFTAEYFCSRSGENTILSPNASMSLNSGGVGMQNGEGYTRRQRLLPQDLYRLQPGFGYVFVAGLSNAIPAYFPPYFDVDLLARRARKNPWYLG